VFTTACNYGKKTKLKKIIQKNKMDILDAIKRDKSDTIKRAGFAGFTGYKK
jgi:hypothetical protein